MTPAPRWLESLQDKVMQRGQHVREAALLGRGELSQQHRSDEWGHQFGCVQALHGSERVLKFHALRRLGVTPRCWGSGWDAADLEPLHTRVVRREVVARLRQQRDPPLRRVASDFQEETAGRWRSKGDGEGTTAQLYTVLFGLLEDFIIPSTC